MLQAVFVQSQNRRAVKMNHRLSRFRHRWLRVQCNIDARLGKPCGTRDLRGHLEKEEVAQAGEDT